MKAARFASMFVAGLIVAIPSLAARRKHSSRRRQRHSRRRRHSSPATPRHRRRSARRSTSSARTSSSETGRGQFQADLTKEDFEVYEDGIKQELSSFVLVHGGRVYQSQTAATPRRFAKGSFFPPRGRSTTRGRIIIFVIDDLHLEFRDTHRVRSCFANGQRARPRWRPVRHRLDRDVVDCHRPHLRRTRMEEAANRITGGGLKPSEIVQQSSTGETPRKSCTARTWRSKRSTHADQPRAGAQPPQGGGPDQQRLRLRSVQIVAHGHAGAGS